MSTLCRVVAVVLVTALPLSAQSLPSRDQQVREAPLFYLTTNVVATTLSVWAQSRQQKPSLARVLAAGTAGGVLMYGGQRVIATGEPALRLAGLQSVAIAANVARNVARKERPFSTLLLPLYPFYLTILPDSGKVRLRASALALINVGILAARGEKPALLESLYSGAAVFARRGSEIGCYERGGAVCTTARVGEHKFGAIVYASDPGPTNANDVAAHELIHVSQDVRDAVLNAVPMSDYALRSRGDFGRALSRFVVLDFFLPFGAASLVAGPSGFDPACRQVGKFYECEAYALD